MAFGLTRPIDHAQDMIAWSVLQQGLIIPAVDITFNYHAASTRPSSRTCYMVGFDVHRDTIAARVYDEDLRRYFDAHEFSP